jgi:hypothetical protein
MVGYQGGSELADLLWHEDLQIWVLLKPDLLDNRFWCAFGVDDPQSTSMVEITCEINPPRDGVDRRCAGLFVLDHGGNVVLAHSGKIGGGRAGIGKAAFLSYTGNADIVSVTFPDGDEYEYIAIGRIDDPDFRQRLTNFVRTVSLFKSEAVGESEKIRPETSRKAGPWLYTISEGDGHTFDLADGHSIPVSIESFRTLVHNGRITEDRYWYISQHWKNVKIDHEVFIYTGDRDLGIIGYATVAGVEERGERWCILPRFDLGRCRALLDHPIPAVVVREWVFPRRNVSDLGPFHEQLHARLPWTSRDQEIDAVLPEEIIQPGGLIEGAVRSITVNAFERNPQARRQCIDAHGTTCCICGFDFAATYGKVGEGYIHVHHLLPLSEVNREYIVDPIKDLRPVCPNCHAVVHRGGECRSIEDVKRMVEDNCS